MAGRGRGRGALARWTISPGQPLAASFDGRAVASVPPLKKDGSIFGNGDSVSSDRRVSCVRITCIIDVNHFWAQLGSASDLEHFDRYMYALNQWCDAQPSGYNDMPLVGQVVCVKHPASGRWRRAEVTRLSQRMADVFFLDFGEAECVSVEVFCSGAPSNVTAWPPQALYCTLDGVQPANNENQWSQAAICRFRDLISCENRLLAYHAPGSFQLALYIRNDNGDETSISSILAREGFAQEMPSDVGTNIPDQACPSDSQKDQPSSCQEPTPLDKQQLEQLEKLEQQLVMSGFTYLVPASQGNEQASRPKDYGFGSTTTISSTFFQYKGKHGGLHGVTGVKREHDHFSGNDFQQAPSISSGHSMAQSLPQRPNSGRESRHSPASFGNDHGSSRPHLASPGEFTATSKGLASLPTRTQEQTSAFTVPDEQPDRYLPPHLRMGQQQEPDRANREEASTKWPEESSLIGNPWLASDMQETLKQPHEQHFLSDKRPPSSHTHPQSLSQEGSNLFPTGHIAFHGPKLGRRSLAAIFSTPVKSDHGEVSKLQAYAQEQQQQQHIPRPQLHEYQQQQQQQRDPVRHFEPLKVQPTNENSNDKAMKKELEWQKWKFQRNLKKILDRASLSNIEELSCELAQCVAESRLSQNFKGVSETVVMLEMIIERVLDGKSFSDIATKLCWLLSGLEVSMFQEHFRGVVLAFRDELIEQHISSSWETRCERFCSFLANMFVTLNLKEGSAPQNLKQAVLLVINQSLNKWVALDKNLSEAELNVRAACLCNLLKVIGPVMEENRGSCEESDLRQMFGSTLRDLVLSTELPRSTRERLLDLLLHRASGWCSPCDESENQAESCSDSNQDVLVEPENSDDGEFANSEDTSQQNDLIQDKEEDQAGWDPYAQVSTMLEQLKLDDLFPKFRDNCIRDSLLTANKDEFKKTLQEAGFPPGVILEIRMFLDEGYFPLKARPIQKPTTVPADASSSGANSSTHQDVPAEQKHVPPNTTEEDHARTEVNELHRELNQLMTIESTGGSLSKRMPSPKGKASPSLEGTPYSRRSSVSERLRRFSSGHSADEGKQHVIIDSHNTFEPSYLSRTPPLRVDTTAFDFDLGPVSPSAQNQLTYSAVVKAKNEEASPEAASKTVPVKLTALTRGNETNKDVSPKTVSGKGLEESKDGTGKRDQSRSLPRPPPGFPPLPPQTWAQGQGKGELRLTVLNSTKPRGKCEEDGAEGESAPWCGKLGSDQEESKEREHVGPSRGGYRGGRGGMSRGYQDNKSWGEPGHVQPQGAWSDRCTGPTRVSRERADRQEERPRETTTSRGGFGGFGRPERSRTQQEHSSYKGGFGIPSDSQTFSRTSSSQGYGGGFYDEAPSKLQPFGQRGPKACYICGSPEHLHCDDRTKLFID
ncbi:uncharacterized protein LOC5506343 isoform X2 [Nematostella vectensis]|uniref:uncharacterized protein LOC5506343 isoform X2 n=1 Tax=Nematostella vectensis TaxID=45351 RepID=UPI0020775DD1|nr:uncharacterized protein LOC5506343 isoform X2 [Nematostella vectensis]